VLWRPIRAARLTSCW